MHLKLLMRDSPANGSDKSHINKIIMRERLLVVERDGSRGNTITLYLSIAMNISVLIASCEKQN